MPERHSSVVGGSTAKRMIHCPGARRLCAQMPKPQSSKHADRGTLLHEAIALILDEKVDEPQDVIGTKYKGIELTKDLYHEKIVPALEEFDELVDECDGELEYVVESSCHMRSVTGAFGTADILARTPTRTIVLDWKFGDGVSVPASENAQGMFYAGAAMETPGLSELFDDDDKWPVEIIIIQPVAGVHKSEITSRWVTNVERIKKFVMSLAMAVRESKRDDAPLARGDWCRFCPAQPTCPEYTGLAEEALKQDLDNLDPEELGYWLDAAEDLGSWIKAVKQLGHDRLERAYPIDGWKLVAKRAMRMFSDEDVAKDRLLGLVKDPAAVLEIGVVSPAQAEKVLKADGEDPEKIADLIVSKSSGTTLARDSDKRPAVQTAPATIRSLANRANRQQQQ